MNAITYIKHHKQLSPVAGLMVAMATLVIPMDAAAQTHSSNPIVLSRSQQPQNYTVLHVDAANGNDQQGTGAAAKPYKTVTKALQMARSGVSTVILLAPGHYSKASGETFPLRLRTGVTIQGNAGEARNTMIVGSGDVGPGQSPHSNTPYNATVVTADRSGLANLAVSNPKGNGVLITNGSPVLRRVVLVSNSGAGIHVGDSAPVIENSYFNRNRHGLVIEGNSTAMVRGNYFDATGQAITIARPATPTIHNNRIARNDVGIALRNNAQPRLEANILNGNGRNGVVEVDPTDRLAELPSIEAEETEPIAELSSIEAEEPEPRAEIPIAAAPALDTVATEINVPAVADPAVENGTSAPAAVPIGSEERTWDAESELADPEDTSNRQNLLARVSTPEIDPDNNDSRNLDPNESSPSNLEDWLEPEETEANPLIAEDLALDTAPTLLTEGAIPIAVIPAGNDGGASDTPVSKTSIDDGAGISNLLARLNSQRTEQPGVNNAPAPNDESLSMPSQRLPVPSAAIPSGTGSNQLLPPDTTSLAQTFRYQVLVDLDDAQELKTLVPDAFRTEVGRRPVMQAGAYVDEAEAQERLEWLEYNGIDARINVRN